MESRGIASVATWDRLSRLAATVVVASAAMLTAAGTAHAQQAIDSTTALKRACEGAVNHHVYVDVDVKIDAGPRENVAGGCKVSLGPSANFEANGVSMGFAGPLEIYGARDRSITFKDSFWEARSLSVYGGGGGDVTNVASRLRATAGNVTISTGTEGDIRLQDRPAGFANGLEATGLVSINGGSKLFLSFADTGIVGRQGVQIGVGGNDGVLKAERVEIRGGRGPVTISSTGAKALVELERARFTSLGNATVNLAGSEATLKAVLTRFQSDGGSVNLLAGGPSGRIGAIELVDSDVYAARGTSVQGSPTAEKGIVKVGGASTLHGGAGDVLVKTGSLGTTEVNGAAMWSDTAIRILTGQGGTCVAEKNSYGAPVQRICQ